MSFPTSRAKSRANSATKNISVPNGETALFLAHEATDRSLEGIRNMASRAVPARAPCAESLNSTTRPSRRTQHLVAWGIEGGPPSPFSAKQNEQFPVAHHNLSCRAGPAIHRASVREMESFRRVTCEQALACFARRAGWMAASVGRHDEKENSDLPSFMPASLRPFRRC